MARLAVWLRSRARAPAGTNRPRVCCSSLPPRSIGTPDTVTSTFRPDFSVAVVARRRDLCASPPRVERMPRPFNCRVSCHVVGCGAQPADVSYKASVGSITLTPGSVARRVTLAKGVREAVDDDFGPFVLPVQRQAVHQRARVPQAPVDEAGHRVRGVSTTASTAAPTPNACSGWATGLTATKVDASTISCGSASAARCARHLPARRPAPRRRGACRRRVAECVNLSGILVCAGHRHRQHIGIEPHADPGCRRRGDRHGDGDRCRQLRRHALRAAEASGAPQAEPSAPAREAVRRLLQRRASHLAATSPLKA